MSWSERIPMRSADSVSDASIPLERMHWFTGRFVTARDLTDEQDYFLRRRWLLNRLFHGDGVLHGLEVCSHPDKHCASEAIVVTPGVALDCAGRELVLEQSMCIEWSASASAGDNEIVLVAIRYGEVGVAPRYAARDACTTTIERRSTRLRECVEVRLFEPGDGPCGWPACGRLEASGCVEAHCRCGEWVPLAVLERQSGGAITIRSVSRRVTAPRYLTHIRQVNWKHGGTLSMRDIADRKGRLEISFDRPIQPATGDATGINQFTYQVEFSGPQRVLEFLPSAGSPQLEDTTAVFTIDSDLWESPPGSGGAGQRWGPRLEGQRVVVTLFCDYILDCHGNPVDGDFLGAKLPTGNGTSGGVFRSWFWVTS